MEKGIWKKQGVRWRKAVVPGSFEARDDEWTKVEAKTFSPGLLRQWNKLYEENTGLNLYMNALPDVLDGLKTDNEIASHLDTKVYGELFYILKEAGVEKMKAEKIAEAEIKSIEKLYGLGAEVGR